MHLETIEKIKRQQMIAASGVIQMRKEIVAAAEQHLDETFPLLNAADAAYRALEEIHRRLKQLAIEAA